jgi:catechol 2,3-dioxygenase-like lactoylglutathione lyase family enzyme
MAKLSRIAPEIPVSNLQAAIEYYEQKLGFRVVMKMSAGEYAIIERDDIAIHLFQDDTRSHSPIGMHIFTHQLDELHRNCSSVAPGYRRRSCASLGAIVISV